MGIGTETRQQPHLAGGTALRGSHGIRLSRHHGSLLANVPLSAAFLSLSRFSKPLPGLLRHLVFESLSWGRFRRHSNQVEKKEEKAGHGGPHHCIAWMGVVQGRGGWLKQAGHQGMWPSGTVAREGSRSN